MLAYIVVPRTGPQNITKNNSLGVVVRDRCGQNCGSSVDSLNSSATIASEAIM
jgi:hypothetical protein